MADLFQVVGENFFKPLSSQFKKIYVDCLNTIYDAYRTELSYGADREVMVAKLTEYFESFEATEIQFEEEQETLKDARQKAAMFLRKLKEYGWIEYDIGNDQKIRIVMPDYAVSFIQTIKRVTKQEEMEYQSEISAIYSLLTNEELLARPYGQVLKPVYDHTLALFTGLKKLNTSIRKYIDDLTADKTSEQILEAFFSYHEEIGSKAYHRIKTSDNVSKFRNIIVGRLQDLLENKERYELAVQGYMNIEGITDSEEAAECIRGMISDVIEHFRSYDEIVEEIDKRNSKYIRNAVERARFLLLNSNNTEGKISKILQYLSEEFNREEENNLAEDAPEELCRIFHIFPQGFLSSESLKSVPITKKITDVDEIQNTFELNEEARQQKRMMIREKNKNRFSRKNITAYVLGLLEKEPAIRASALEISSRRDMIRIIFISLYGRAEKSEYLVIPGEEWIEKEGFRFRDFTIKRRIR